MKVPFVDLSRIHQPIKEEIIAAIGEVVAGNSFISGKYVQEFEDQFAAYIHVGHCISCANGTDALELVLEGLGIGQGDEVIVPVHSWISTASAVSRVGARPVFVDTLADEFTIDPLLIGDAISPKTRAIIAVHLYGQPCQMDEIMLIAKRHDLFVIEDCAQAHGAEYHGKKAGSMGDAGCFSFYPSKNLGAMGDGGAVTTNNAALAQKLQVLRNCGQSKKNVISAIGRNSRLDALQAAVLSVKLKYLDTWNSERQAIAAHYNNQLQNIPEIIPPARIEGRQSIHHLYVIRAQNRPSLVKRFEENGIGSEIHYPFLLNTCFNDPGNYANAGAYVSEIISLPMFAGMKRNEITTVASVLKGFYA